MVGGFIVAGSIASPSFCVMRNWPAAVLMAHTSLLSFLVFV